NQTSASGSTCTISILHNSTIYTAWVGDSPAYIFKSDGTPFPLISEHTGKNPSEKLRAEAAGGIFLFDGVTSRLNGVIMVTRSFGDFRMRGLTAEPEIVVNTLDDSDRFLVVCSDGVTEVLEAEEVWASINYTASRNLRARVRSWVVVDTTNMPVGGVGIGKRASVNKTDEDGDVTTWSQLAVGAADDLVNLAVERGSGDNVSAVVVDLAAWRRGVASRSKGGMMTPGFGTSFDKLRAVSFGDKEEVGPKEVKEAKEIRRDGKERETKLDDDGSGEESVGSKLKQLLRRGSLKNTFKKKVV
ncbi:hypothetical protein HK096_001152, partial [Nowakowskiella sp. JEL0078]